MLSIKQCAVHVLFVGAALEIGVAAAQTPSPPRVFLFDGNALVLAREKVRAGNDDVKPAFEGLIRAADSVLDAGPFSVMNKQRTPPSGDRHDYMSIGPYWWPDPDKPDGLPYIRRDGEVNPERNDYDNLGMGKMKGAVQSLTLAYYLTSDEKYAERASLLLRTWFLDEATRMNPHLTYGQAIPGRCIGRGIGIIDTTGLPGLVDAVALLEGSKTWPQAHQAALEKWFADYLDWLLTSAHGRMEAMTRNNHGVWYDVQVASYALFAHKEDIARGVLEKTKERRIAHQIKPDGRQPEELARTKSFSYSLYNLHAFFDLATMADHLGIDLWTFETEDGRGIRKAMDWLIEHAVGKTKEQWGYKQITSYNPSALAPFLRRAAIACHEPRYEDIRAGLVGDDWAAARENLWYPTPEF